MTSMNRNELQDIQHHGKVGEEFSKLHT